MRWLDKISAVFRRDLLTATRYRAALSLAAVGGLLEIAGLFYLARAIGPAFHPEGMQSYPFLLVGTGLYSFMLMGISCFLTTIKEAQQAGTLEVLMTTSTPPLVWLLLSSVCALAGRVVTFLIYLIAGLVIAGVHISFSRWLPSMMVMVLCIAVTTALGIVAAAVQLGLQKGTGLMWLFSSAVGLMTGTMFPVSALPRSLQGVAALIPITHCLRALRMALFAGFTPGLARELVVLTLMAGLLLPVSVSCFAEVLRRARLNGTLSRY